MEAISRSSLPDSSWKQATLPIRHGGLGLREACRTAPTAFIGSCNFTRDLIHRLLGYAHSPVLSSNEAAISDPDLIVIRRGSRAPR